RQVVTMQRKLYGDEHLAVAVSLESLGLILQERGKLAEAEINLREALSIQRKFLSDESPQRLTFFRHLAELLEVAGKLAEAETVYRQMLDLRLECLGGEHLDVAESFNALANVLKAQGKLTEAETMYRRALIIRRKLLGDGHQLVADSVNKLLSLLLSQKKFGEAEQILTGLLTPALIGNPRSVALLNARVELFARRGRWKEAAVDASIVLEYQPTNHLAYHTLAPLLVASGDLVLYQRLCQRMMSQFVGTIDACAADRVAKDCLMLPLSEVNLRLVCNLADTAVTNGSKLVAIPFFQTCKALAEYRQGRFTAAREWAQKALEGRIVFAQAEAYPVLAMAHYRLNQKDDARAVLAKGNDFVKSNLPRVNSDDFGVDWRDWIIAHALIEEATALIEGKPASESNPYKK
ncbi:MAG: Serine/threonine protein kinase with repeat, partial [Pedosphaera sp.]|nr:Serine/threonine protein kinase with repeat [Pedosphaera sp.]